jgi:hypothetical protein
MGKKKHEEKWAWLSHRDNCRRMKFLSNLDCSTEDDISDTWVNLSIRHCPYLVECHPSKTRYFWRLNSDSSCNDMSKEKLLIFSLRTFLILIFNNLDSYWRWERLDIIFSRASRINASWNVSFFSRCPPGKVYGLWEPCFTRRILPSRSVMIPREEYWSGRCFILLFSSFSL